MNKGAGFFNTLFMIILIGIIIYGGYYLYQNFPREAIQLRGQNIPEITVDNNIPSKQFYDNMRYSDRTINYYISDACSESKASSMREALDIIESKTVLKFNPVSESESVLNILCSDISPQAEEEDHFVAGEGGPSKVINSTLYSLILEGKVALYREGNCANSNVAIHELLHALGFDHNNNRNSILYPTLECDQTIDDGIIKSINQLYQDPSLPDLVFSKIDAKKSGAYLNFHMEVLNRGLKSSSEVDVKVYADGKYVDSFNLNTISIGAKKIIDVENLKVPLNSKEIKFIIDDKDDIREIYEDNNKITLNTN